MFSKLCSDTQIKRLTLKFMEILESGQKEFLRKRKKAS